MGRTALAGLRRRLRWLGSEEAGASRCVDDTTRRAPYVGQCQILVDEG